MTKLNPFGNTDCDVIVLRLAADNAQVSLWKMNEDTFMRVYVSTPEDEPGTYVSYFMGSAAEVEDSLNDFLLTSATHGMPGPTLDAGDYGVETLREWGMDDIADAIEKNQPTHKKFAELTIEAKTSAAQAYIAGWKETHDELLDLQETFAILTDSDEDRYSDDGELIGQEN